MAWVHAVRRQERTSAPPLPGSAAAEAVHSLAAALCLAGLVLGVFAALGAFSYQPSGRINVVAVLAALIGVQWIFLVLALLNALPARLRRLLPWIGGQPEGGGLLQPARWALRWLPQSVRETLERAWGVGRSWEHLSAGMRRWLLLSLSQAAAVAFNVGILAAGLTLVVFTDLSFGWSTTLALDAASVYRATDLVSAPWAWALPNARPSLALIEATRFFRIAAEPEPGISLETYGHWWPFLLLCLATYGLLPRLAFFAWARGALRRALRHAICAAPGSRLVLDRMESPLLETAAVHGEDTAPGTADADRPAAPELAPSPALPLHAVVLSWADALGEGTPPEAFDCAPVEQLRAGGRRTPAEDRVAILQAAAVSDKGTHPVVVLVRGFEPPLAEQLDFLRALRDALGRGREIFVGTLGGGTTERTAWRHRLATLGDPWLALVELRPQPAAADAEAGA